MVQYTKISDAEWRVIKVLWNKSPMTSTEIIDSIKPESSWSPKTIHTLISRLVKKNVLGVKKDSSLNLYFPLVTEEECRRIETKSFLKKLYDGSLQQLVANFIKDEKMSQQEIEELKRILDNQNS